MRLLRGKIARNALSLYAVQGLNFLMPLILLPYLLRVLSPTGYGSIVFAQAFMSYAVLLTDFGFNLTAARDISVARDDPDRVARVYWSTMAAKAFLLLASLILVGVPVCLVARLRQEWDVFAASSLLLVGSAFFPSWYFQGLERMREVATIQAVSKCVTTAAVFMFVREPGDKLVAALIMSGSQVAGMIASLLLRIPAAPARFYRPTCADIRSAIVGSADMFFASASTSLYIYTNTFVLGLMSGERAVAFYSLGNRLVGAVQGLSSPVTQAVFPRASMLFASRPAEGWRLVRRVAWALFPVMALVLLAMVVLAPAIVRFFGSNSYQAAIPVVRIMAPIPLLVTAASVLGQTVMVNIGLSRYLWRIYVGVGILNLMLLGPLVRAFEANGAALSLTLAELIGPLVMAWVLWKKRAIPLKRFAMERHS